MKARIKAIAFVFLAIYGINVLHNLIPHTHHSAEDLMHASSSSVKLKHSTNHSTHAHIHANDVWDDVDGGLFGKLLQNHSHSPETKTGKELNGGSLFELLPAIPTEIFSAVYYLCNEAFVQTAIPVVQQVLHTHGSYRTCEYLRGPPVGC